MIRKDAIHFREELEVLQAILQSNRDQDDSDARALRQYFDNLTQYASLMRNGPVSPTVPTDEASSSPRPILYVTTILRS